MSGHDVYNVHQQYLFRHTKRGVHDGVHDGVYDGVHDGVHDSVYDGVQNGVHDGVHDVQPKYLFRHTKRGRETAGATIALHYSGKCHQGSTAKDQ